MGTVTTFTSERILEIEGETIVSGEVIGGDLILTKNNGGTVNAGPVVTDGATNFIGQYTTATRPDATLHTGKILWDTDLGQFYKSNGTIWELFDLVTQTEFDAVPEIAAGPGIDVATVGSVSTVSIEEGFSDLAISTYVRATADQQVVSSAALVSDNELLLPVDAGSLYEVQAKIIYDADSASDFRAGWSAPVGATMDWLSNGLISSATGAAAAIDKNVRDIATSAIIGATTAGTRLGFEATGILDMAVTSGFLIFRFAQGTSGATPSIRKAGSLLKLRKLD